MADLIEGKRAVIEALRSNVPIKCIFMADNIEQDGMVKDIQRKAKQQHIEIKLEPRKALDRMLEAVEKPSKRAKDHGDKSSDGKRSNKVHAHQGVIAEVDPFAYASLKEIIANANASDEGAEHALVVICDHITDAGNLGAIIRSAECVGASGVVIPNKRSAQVNPTVYKTSAGAVSHIPIAQVPNLAAAIRALKDAGFWVGAATEKTDTCIWDANLKGKLAIVMGNEQEGISRLLLEESDFSFKLPQMGKVSSLNVAQSATACMYEWLRQNTASSAKGNRS